ncbi:MAG: PadR family transcriptional regulator [Acidobacteria bacterium]|nr:PadR family transcriptional regulator [Acidobacteriota bacterium]
MNINRWKSQLMKGAAELACLAILRERPCYGVEILETLSSLQGLEISDGSIYPLLNRLQRDGKLEAAWREDEDAIHPRKYYRLTPLGRAALGEMVNEWRGFSRAVDRLIQGGGQ